MPEEMVKNRVMRWQDICPDKVITPEQAAKLVKSGDRVLIGAGFHQAIYTCLALAERKDELENVTISSQHGRPWPWLFPNPGEKSFSVASFITTQVSRQIDKEKRTEWIPNIWGLNNGIHHTEPMRGRPYVADDVFIFPVTKPDKNGWCSFGPGVWYHPVCARAAKIAIGEVDPDLVWTCGEAIHVSELSYLVDAGGPPPRTPAVLPIPPENEIEPLSVIGAHVAELIRDGDTIETGSGSGSEAVLEFLTDKNDLSIDTEVMPSMMLDLIKAGVFNGKRNKVHPGKHLLTACLIFDADPRRDELMAQIDHNPAFEFRDVSYICNIPRIASSDNFVAINTALSVDLTGQAVVAHLGDVPITGIGGQLEFTIGAHYSRGGRSVTALLSAAKGGTVSRIVPQFEAGAMIDIPNVYVDYLATEYGMVNLSGKSLRQRAEAIISVAHPDFRPELMKAAKKLFWP